MANSRFATEAALEKSRRASREDLELRDVLRDLAVIEGRG